MLPGLQALSQQMALARVLIIVIWARFGVWELWDEV